MALSFLNGLYTSPPTIDDGVRWGICAKANTRIADSLAFEPQYRIYRDAGVALTKAGDSNPDAARFVTFLKSPQGAAIFRKWGWMATASGPAVQPANKK